MRRRGSRRVRRAVLYSLLIAVVFASPLVAATLEFSQSKTTPRLHYTLSIDKVSKLAGLKIVVNYPKTQIKFIDARKLEPTSSFLHVVNSKQPGRLIIVMASARGVSGSDLALLDLSFSRLQRGMKPVRGQLSISTCQLMSETLKKISCESAPLQLRPPGS